MTVAIKKFYEISLMRFINITSTFCKYETLRKKLNIAGFHIKKMLVKLFHDIMECSLHVTYEYAKSLENKAVQFNF